MPLILKNIYEQKYWSVNGQRKQFYKYELCLGAEASENSEELNVNSKLEFDCDSLDLIIDSLMFNGKRKLQKGSESSDESAIYITVEKKINRYGGSTIQIHYSMSEFCDNFEIIFKIRMRSKLNIDMIHAQNIEFDQDAATFHRNGLTEQETWRGCLKLQKRFTISSIADKIEPSIPKTNEFQTCSLNNDDSSSNILPISDGSLTEISERIGLDEQIYNVHDERPYLEEDLSDEEYYKNSYQKTTESAQRKHMLRPENIAFDSTLSTCSQWETVIEKLRNRFSGVFPGTPIIDYDS